MVDDPHLYPAPEDDIPERLSSYWLGALAVDVTVYPNQDAWREDSEPLLTNEQATKELGGEVSADIRIGPRFIASPGYWVLPATTTPALKPGAVLDGTLALTGTTRFG